MAELNGYDDSEPANVIANDDYVIPASKDNVDKALKFIDSLDSYGGIVLIKMRLLISCSLILF